MPNINKIKVSEGKPEILPFREVLKLNFPAYDKKMLNEIFLYLLKKQNKNS